MNIEDINSTMEHYIANQEIAGGALIVRKKDKIVFQNKWGFANIASRKPVEFDSIFRMMSMTKCVIAVGVMILIEKGKLDLDDPVSKFIPSFQNMRVANDKRYQFTEDMKMADVLRKLLFFQMRKVKTIPAQREITIRDLLSHSSGLEQGIVGLLAMTKDRGIRKTLALQAEKYANYALDFQPGTGTGYSPLASFDILTYIIEIVSGQEAAEFIQNEIFEPLEMKNTTFWPDAEQQTRLVSVYKRSKGKLKDVTNTKEDLDGMLHRGKGYISGSGGLFSTLTDYEHFVWMLCNGGSYNGIRLLKPETVVLMQKEAPAVHLEPEPGFVWGLGVKIRQDPTKYDSSVTEGTYGWSGAFGTHFFISPKDNLDCVWLVNRSDLNGAGSYISKKVEELVFGLFGDTKTLPLSE